MSQPSTRTLLQSDKLPNGRSLTREEREKLLKPYLPAARSKEDSPVLRSSSSTPNARTQPRRARSLSTFTPRTVIGVLLHKLLFFLIQAVFSVYIFTRQTYHAVGDRVFSVLYYHHRTPELIQRDVRNLGKVPRHLSVVVELTAMNSREAVDGLIDEVAELSAWCACAGIAMLSVYERTGALKSVTPELYHTTLNTFASYFPRDQRPTLHISAPDRSAYSPSPSPSRSPSPARFLDGSADSKHARPHLKVLLISANDGRGTLVDLTKTLAEMAQKGKIAPSDVTPELIHAEIEEGSGCGEPDLLVIMGRGRGSAYTAKRRVKMKRKQGVVVKGLEEVAASHRWVGDGICLHGYPPWQVRLTEIFHVQDSSGIGYQLFLRALHRYAKAEMRFGR